MVCPHGVLRHAREATRIGLHNHASTPSRTVAVFRCRRRDLGASPLSAQVSTIRAILHIMSRQGTRNLRGSYAGGRKQAIRGLTSPTRNGLTSRTTSEDGSPSTRKTVRPSLEVLRGRRATSARPDNLIEDLESCIQPVDETGCLAPACHEVVAWPKAGGRPSRFCSRSCQERFERERARLLAEVAEIEAALPVTDAPAERRYLSNQLSRRTWLLERYPLPYKEQARLLKAERHPK